MKIIRTTYKDIKEFNLRAWAQADKEHYGKDVDWKMRKYTFKAEENGEIVGTLRMKIQAGVAEIGTIIVAFDKRNKGIGKALMANAEEVAKKSGVHKIYLVTGKDWQAQKFYQSLGYQKTGELPKHYVKHDFIGFCKLI